VHLTCFKFDSHKVTAYGGVSGLLNETANIGGRKTGNGERERERGGGVRERERGREREGG
jgi:hypothetical protein